MLTVGLYGVPDPTGSQRTHDHAVAFVREGEVLASLELERVTGRKHDDRLGEHLEALLRPWIVPGEPVRLVQANSFLGATVATSSGSLVLEGPARVEIEPRLAPSRLHLSGASAGLRATGWTVSHELAHVGSCLPFLPAGLQPRTLLVHVDGGASRSACSVWWWDGAGLSCLHHAWRDLKDAVNNFNDNPLSARVLGIPPSAHLSMPGKLMGLAAHGTPREPLRRWLEGRGHGMGSQAHGDDLLAAACAAFEEPVPEDATASRIGRDIAACMQAFFEEAVLGFLARWRDRTGARHLAYAGGAALNVLANARIERELGFETVVIPPVPSDCGLALGAACIASWLDGVAPTASSPYLARRTPGDEGGPLACEGLLDTRAAAGALAAGDVVAAVVGVAEAGPRALGHRSLLARADSVALRRHLSEGIKRREPYRPVAPMLLPEVARDALVGFDPGSRLAPYMLGAWRVADAWKPALAGCLHADGSVRAQVVDAAVPGQAPLAALLHCLREQHGVHALINTSLNGPGVPMLADRAAAASAARELGVRWVWGG